MLRNLKQIHIKYLLVLIWMLVIFYLSSEPATASTSRSDIFLRAIQSVDILSLSDVSESIVRKSAHFIAYLILGILLFNAVREYLSTIKLAIVTTVAIAVAYACTDEIHQLFVVGRSGQLLDVFIDTIGAAVGVVLYLLVLKLRR
jgi:VanZ family protein